MLPVVTRSDPETPGGRGTMLDRAVVSFGKEPDADFDDLQVPVAMADVEPCMHHEPMSSRCSVIEGSGRHGRQAGLALQQIDGSVGE